MQMESIERQYKPTQQSYANWLKVVARQRTLLLVLPLAIALSGLAGAAEASHYQREVLALSGIAILVVFVCVRPNLYVLTVAAMLLVPYSWSPTLVNAPTPAIMLFALPGGLAGAAVLIRRGRLRLCVFDYLVMAIFVSALLSEIATAPGAGILGSHTLSHNEVEVLLLPYLAFRLILAAWPRAISKLPEALMITGAGLSLLAIWEELTRANLFSHSSLNNPELVVWEQSYLRAGGVRADAAMGHPIALGSFLIIPLVFAFGQRRWRLFVLLALGEVLTLSRGPYIAVLIALLLCGILTQRVGRLLVLVTVIGVMALFIGPVRNSVTNSFQGGTGEQKTANYRSELLGTSLSSLTFWGKTTGATSELFAHQGEFKLPDVTSEFALISGRQGVLGLTIWVGFLTAFAYVIREARRRSDSLLLLLGVALVGEWVSLLSVALITSFQYAFWLTVAMAAARLSQRTGVAELSRRAPDLAYLDPGPSVVREPRYGT
jgi:hypothetical protein